MINKFIVPFGIDNNYVGIIRGEYENIAYPLLSTTKNIETNIEYNNTIINVLSNVCYTTISIRNYLDNYYNYLLSASYDKNQLQNKVVIYANLFFGLSILERARQEGNYTIYNKNIIYSKTAKLLGDEDNNYYHYKSLTNYNNNNINDASFFERNTPLLNCYTNLYQFDINEHYVKDVYVFDNLHLYKSKVNNNYNNPLTNTNYWEHIYTFNPLSRQRFNLWNVKQEDLYITLTSLPSFKELKEENFIEGLKISFIAKEDFKKIPANKFYIINIDGFEFELSIGEANTIPRYPISLKKGTKIECYLKNNKFILVNKYNNFLDKYKVGCIYLQMPNTLTPAERFGGEWYKIKNKYLKACNVNSIPMTTGGGNKIENYEIITQDVNNIQELKVKTGDTKLTKENLPLLQPQIISGGSHRHLLASAQYTGSNDDVTSTDYVWTAIRSNTTKTTGGCDTSWRKTENYGGDLAHHDYIPINENLSATIDELSEVNITYEYIKIEVWCRIK